MAKFGSILDGGKGRLGNLVLYKLKGQNIMRTKPDHFTDCCSPKQLEWRLRFSTMNHYLNQFSNTIKVTYAAEAGRRTALNMAVSHNIHHALAGEYPDIYVDRSRLLLSRGPLPVPEKAWLSPHPEGYLVQWENGPECTGDDKTSYLMVIILNKKGGSDYRITDTRRTAGQHVCQSTTLFKNIDSAWIVFRNREMTIWSNSKLLEMRG